MHAEFCQIISFSLKRKCIVKIQDGRKFQMYVKKHYLYLQLSQYIMISDECQETLSPPTTITIYYEYIIYEVQNVLVIK